MQLNAGLPSRIGRSNDVTPVHLWFLQLLANFREPSENNCWCFQVKRETFIANMQERGSSASGRK